MQAAEPLGDTVDGTDAGESLRGGDGDDLILGRGGADTLRGRGGDDTVDGGAGDDLVYLDGGHDRLIGGGGVDTLRIEPSKTYSVAIDLAAGTAIARSTDTVDGFENVSCGDGHDFVAGDGAANLLSGGEGADTLSGADGADTLVGGRGADRLSGGAGADTFLFGASDRLKVSDLIEDLQRDDVIDLSAIDADRRAPGNQAFHLVEEYSGARGELALQWAPDEGVTYLLAQVGIGDPDVVIVLLGKHDHFPGLVL